MIESNGFAAASGDPAARRQADEGGIRLCLLDKYKPSLGG